MPEGPEIRRAADKIAKVLVDQPIEEVKIALPALRRYSPELRDERILRIEPRGKALHLFPQPALRGLENRQARKATRDSSFPSLGDSYSIAQRFALFRFRYQRLASG